MLIAGIMTGIADDVVDVDITDIDNVDDIRENKLLTLNPVIIIQQSQ